MLTRPIANAPGHLAVVPTAFGPVEVMRCAGTVQSSSSSLAATVPPPRRGADLYTELGVRPRRLLPPWLRAHRRWPTERG
jgi:hypothetical protein